ncbi:cytochrome c biogenesis protein ResB [Desulfosporosinus metallidurans]|uniref:Cytochrome c-type biogenesis protein Ccs1/ResB n=1 Tax=Desulfosporosinus metallidurans TaxID=1888891 RepID=A0A1Q8QW84_9FIRM|nr:cytochrome c biogenesis protein ResB [Desulfosporosinus metallidurans]OLN31599.1 Cytochrome c-type biogenesis protein Ccs1/ResB [Desulfosporosinus metallidurans]
MSEQQEGIIEKVWRFFSSMKLGLALLGIIALVAGLGTLFPQVNVDPAKAQTVGQIWQKLGFTNLYGTFWFRLLLGLLCINLIVCSVQRFQGVYNRTFKLKPPEGTSTVPKKVQAKWAGDGESLKLSVREVLKRRGYKIVTKENDAGWSFIAIKRRLGNWGSIIAHVSFVVLVIGALLGSFMGFKGFFMTGAGTTIPINSINVSRGTVKHDFSVRINSAEDRFLANGERDNWYTDMSILKNGQEVATQTISVNHPFTYEGVTFYQSSFAKGVHLTADLKGKKIPLVLQEQGGNYFQAEGTNLYLIAAAISSEQQTTSIVYQVYKGTASQPIQTGQLKVGQTIDIQGQYKLTLDGNAGFTGLQVKEDPGVMVIWFGCALLLGGLLLSFYWRTNVVLGVFIAKQGNQGELTMGALAGKVAGGVQSEFERLIHDIKMN